MKSKSAILVLRLVIAAALYTAVATFWVQTSKGWEGLGVFAEVIAFGVLALVAWFVAIAIGQSFISNDVARLIAHPLLTAALFLAIAAAVLMGYFDDSFATTKRDTPPFAILAALCALADAALDFILARKAAPSPGVS